MTDEDRKHISNGIWLCSSCHDLVDSDEATYPPEKLHEWKKQAESDQRTLVEGGKPYQGGEPLINSRNEDLVTIRRLSTDNAQAYALLSSDAKNVLDTARETWRTGSKTKAIESITEITLDPVRWTSLSLSVQSEILRFQGLLVLDDDDLDEARRLAEQAQKIAPDDNHARLQALIAYHESGAAAGATVLENESDVDSLNLLAAFLLEQEKLPDCEQVLDQTADGANAETHRIRALLFLGSKGVDQARAEIQKAQETARDWIGVRHVAAIIDYYSALSPAVVPTSVVAWPDPVGWSMVKQDKQSISRLRSAEETFRDFLQSRERPSEQQELDEVWKLACMANDAARQEEAAVYARELLDTNPRHHRAVMWALFRNYSFDIDPVIQSLQQVVDTDEASPEHAIALVACLIEKESVTEAATFIKGQQKLFGEENKKVWHYWCSEAQAATGQAQTLLDDDQGPLEAYEASRATLMHTAAQESGNFEPLRNHLIEAYKTTGRAGLLYEACGLSASIGEWSFVADRAAELIEKIDTADALKLAAHGLYQTGRHAECLELLNSHSHFYPSGILPPELRQVRVACSHALGDYSESIREAEALAKEHPTKTNLFNLATLYSQQGDWLCISIVRQLLEQNELTDIEALQLARMVRVDDQELAIRLWRSAIADCLPSTLPDNLATGAYILGHQLGLEQEMLPLSQWVQVLAAEGRGGMSLVPLSEMVKQLEGRRASQEEISHKYDWGQIPIHVACELLNHPLVSWFHDTLTANEPVPTPLRQPYLFIRHGSRTLSPEFSDVLTGKRLHMDLSALLLAEHFELLEDVEHNFKPLHIPSETILALKEMQERVSPAQPVQVNAWQNVVALIDSGSLKVFDPVSFSVDQHPLSGQIGHDLLATICAARETDAMVITYLPVLRADLSETPVTLTRDDASHTVNLRRLLESMREDRTLSRTRYKTVRNRLGSEGAAEPQGPSLPRGGRLYCDDQIVEQLALADLLDMVCASYQVSITKTNESTLRSQIHASVKQKETVQWLGNLTDRIGQGLKNGIYERLPAAPETDTSSDASPGNATRSMMSLLHPFYQGNEIIWADDRWINGHPARGVAPIIGINEVLQSLVAKEIWDEEQYYDMLHRMRAANLRFIPPTSEEILYYLSQAKVRDNQVVETPQLATLRRYMATCLLRGDMLQRPAPGDFSDEVRGELDFVLAIRCATTDALVHLWSEVSDPEEHSARAEWILSHLYLEYPSLALANIEVQLEPDGRYLPAISLADLIIQGWTLLGHQEGLQWLTDYQEWLFNRLMKTRFEADPPLISAVSERLKGLLSERLDSLSPESSKKEITTIGYRFYQTLPDPIKKEIDTDLLFIKKVGYAPLLNITIHGLQFVVDDFWNAATAAVNGQEQVIETTDGARVALTPHDHQAEHHAVRLIDPETGDQLSPDLSLELLHDSEDTRDAWLRQERVGLDLDQNTFETELSRTITTEPPSERIKLVGEWQRTSATIFYQALHRRLFTERAVLLETTRPPSVEGLLRHLRLSPETGGGEDFHKALDIASETLIREENLPEAFSRLCGLPVALPPPFLTHLQSALPNARRQHIKDLLKIAHSSLQQTHLIRLLIQLSKTEPQYGRLARWLTKRLVSQDGEEQAEAFFSVLNWVQMDFGYWPDTKNVPGRLRLVLIWTHADRLYRTLTETGADTNFVTDTFTQKLGERTPVEAFVRDPNFTLDIAFPRFLDRTLFHVLCVSYAIGENRRDWVDPNLFSQLTALTRIRVNGTPHLLPQFWTDPALALNQLNSFLGDDRGTALAPLIGTAEAASFSSERLHEHAKHAVTVLTTEDSSGYWGNLMLTFQNRPPHEDLLSELVSLIQHTNIVDLYKTDEIVGHAALHVSTVVASHAGDGNLTEFVGDQLVDLAELLCQQFSNARAGNRDENKESDSQKAALKLAELARILTLSEDPKQAVADFANIAERLVDAWLTVAKVLHPFVQHLWVELPADQSQAIWRLQVRLRAEIL